MNKIAIFFRKYGHKILTFCIGLAFLGGCAFLLFLGGNRVYHLFKPEKIYEEGVNPDLIDSNAPFEEARSSGYEVGSKEFFELYINNFVKQDFPSFTDPLELKTDYFISYGIWQAIKVNGQGIYAMQEDGSYLIPKEDVEKYARQSFNYVGEIDFHSVDVCGAFTYEKLSGCYRVPSGMSTTFLSPDVIDVKYDESAGIYTLTVDCYIDDGLSEVDVTTDATKFSKRLSLTLQEVEELHTVDGVEMTITDYLYTSCSLVDETIESNTGSETEE